MRVEGLLYVIAFGVPLLGCFVNDSLTEGNPTVLSDSTHIDFEWECNDESCRLTEPIDAIPNPECPAEGPVRYQLGWGRFVIIAATCTSTSGQDFSTVNWERPVACTDSADCPQLRWYEQDFLFECRAGLCQSTDLTEHPVGRVYREEVRLLCFAPIPRAETAGVFVDEEIEALVDKVCNSNDADSVCALPVPAECWQP